MKLDNLSFARLASWISSRTGTQLHLDDLSDLNEIVDFFIPEQEAPPPASEADVNELLRCMQKGDEKIPAIKAYRVLTRAGLKESKDAVEKYGYETRLSKDQLYKKLSDANFNSEMDNIIAKFINECF